LKKLIGPKAVAPSLGECLRGYPPTEVVTKLLSAAHDGTKKLSETECFVLAF
jgi:hypothetical protein